MANDKDSLTRLLDLEEVATALRVSKHTVRMWSRTGRLHPTRICRRLLFDPAHVEQFVRASQTKPTSDLVMPDAASSPTNKRGLQ